MFSYKLLAADPGMVPTSANCKLICVKAGLQGFQVGKTKVFLKYFHIDILVEHLERVQKAAANIQKIVRGFIARKRFQKLLLAAEQQAKMITDFLKLISPPTQGLFDKQKK